MPVFLPPSIMSYDGPATGTRVSPNNMTSNVLPAPFVASSSANSGGAAWNAYDGLAGGTNIWFASVCPQWNQLDFGQITQIGSYTYQFRTDSTDVAPAAWTIQGSNTGAFTGEQTTVDSQTGQTFAQSQARTYTLSQPAAFRFYRMTITASTGTNGALIGDLTYFAP
jgi:hypothetical protein